MLKRAEEEKANADAEDDKETQRVDCDMCAMATQHFCTACSNPICAIFCSKQVGEEQLNQRRHRHGDTCCKRADQEELLSADTDQEELMEEKPKAVELTDEKQDHGPEVLEGASKGSVSGDTLPKPSTGYPLVLETKKKALVM